MLPSTPHCSPTHTLCCLIPGPCLLPPPYPLQEHDPQHVRHKGHPELSVERGPGQYVACVGVRLVLSRPLSGIRVDGKLRPDRWAGARAPPVWMWQWEVRCRPLGKDPSALRGHPCPSCVPVLVNRRCLSDRAQPKSIGRTWHRSRLSTVSSVDQRRPEATWRGSVSLCLCRTGFVPLRICGSCRYMWEGRGHAPRLDFSTNHVSTVAFSGPDIYLGWVHWCRTSGKPLKRAAGAHKCGLESFALACRSSRGGPGQCTRSTPALPQQPRGPDLHCDVSLLVLCLLWGCVLLACGDWGSCMPECVLNCASSSPPWPPNVQSPVATMTSCRSPFGIRAGPTSFWDARPSSAGGIPSPPPGVPTLPPEACSSMLHP